ncbi:Uma2 family endonuclease [Algoriphagus sp.]|uniref:Uma2 family endonuclease n=1 Tax=Algoriphagus sp. TaxID=1872435 RepID=UPI00391ABF7F
MREYRIPQKPKINLADFCEPNDSFAGYSYADYLKWDFEEIVELIKGKIFVKPPSPGRRHQEIRGNLMFAIFNFLTKKPYQVYAAPFDVRFSEKSEDYQVFSVVQPDISVIFDPEKLDDWGCFGSPDLIVEIFSEGSIQMDLKDKYDLYQEFGVREYWIVSPLGNYLQVNTLVDGKYQPSKLFTSGDKIKSSVISGFELDLEEVFME